MGSKEEKLIYSHHVFLFPFNWDLLHSAKIWAESPFAERTDFEALQKWLGHQLLNKQRKQSGCTGSWEEFHFDINNPNDYNEFTYFYPNVRDALFASSAHDAIHRTVVQYRFKTSERLNYELGVEYTPWQQSSVEKNFLLSIDDITLNFYNSGIGILSFHVSNHQTNDPNDILLINDFGRRIYPQFLAKSPFTNQAKESFLARSIALKTIDGEYFTELETFSYYDRLPPLDKVFQLPGHFSQLLGDGFITSVKDLGVISGISKLFISPVIDDRMFVCSWFGSDSLMKTMSAKSMTIPHREHSYGYSDDEWWYKYIFIDGKDLGAQSIKLRQELIADHTYYRHIESGILYGVSRYSLVMLTSHNGFVIDVLLPHLKTMYFQLVILALVQRASVLRFSREATSESSLGFTDLKAQSKALNELHKKYIQFVNKLYFREPTAQEQGIELYKLLQEKMEIERNVKDLNQEITELHQLVSAQQQQEQTEQATNLTKVATILLPATLIAGVLGMNTLDTSRIPEHFFSWSLQAQFIISVVVLACTSFIALSLLDYFFKLNILFKKGNDE